MPAEFNALKATLYLINHKLFLLNQKEIFNYSNFQTLSSQSNNLGWFVQKTISVMLSMGSLKPFVNITADELVFGYDDSLVSLAHQFYPKRKKPQNKMGLLITVSIISSSWCLSILKYRVIFRGMEHYLKYKIYIPVTLVCKNLVS